MSNKNKKKGFLKEMEGVKARKVVFSYDGEGDTIVGGLNNDDGMPTTTTTTTTPNTTTDTTTIPMAKTKTFPLDILPFSSPNENPPTPTRQPRFQFTPPSEIPLDQRAKNLLITSVTFPWVVRGTRNDSSHSSHPDVVEDNRKTRRMKKRQSREDPYLSEEEHLASDSAPAIAPSVSPTKLSAVDFGMDLGDWTRVEEGWEGLKRVVGKEMGGVVGIGSVVAWKVSGRMGVWFGCGEAGDAKRLCCRLLSQELEMNLDTFTPELMIKLGRLISASPPDGLVSIRILTPPSPLDEHELNDHEYDEYSEEYILSKRQERRLEYLAGLKEEDGDEVVVTLNEVDFDSNDYRVVVLG